MNNAITADLLHFANGMKANAILEPAIAVEVFFGKYF